MWLYLAQRSLSASYGPRNRTVSHSRTIFILSSRRCSSFHDYYLAERRRDDKRFVETVSLSLSLEASSWRKLGHFIEDKATSSGLKFTQASIPPSSGFFSFSAENPTETPTLNQSTLSLSRFIAWLIFRDGFISLKIFATRVRHCSTIELIPGNGRDFFFFNLATPRFEYWIDLRLFYRLDPVASIYRSVIDPSEEFVSSQKIFATRVV